VRTTDSSHDLPIAPNLLDRNFTAEAPNRIWLADITYGETGEGWLYLYCLICALLFAEAARMPPRQFNTLRWCDLPQCLNPTNATSAFAANNGHHGLGLMTSTAWYLIQPSPSNASGTWRSACL